MKISGTTIVRNAVKYGYPVVEAVRSVLPICDEYIINVGDSSDGTLELIKSIKDPKIKIVERVWNMSAGKEVLSDETNFAISQCKGDWVLYNQTDEVLHERDLPGIKEYMKRYLNDPKVNALQFRWVHFYGSFFRYRIDAGWFQKQVRVIKNNGLCRSHDDAWGFRHQDGTSLKSVKTPFFIYHYGWVHDPQIMASKIKNAFAIGYCPKLNEKEKKPAYDYGDLSRFPVFFGTHPAVMNHLIGKHALSQQDWQTIVAQYWWNPLLWFRVRYKTGRRVKEKII
ncbi:MAG: glycosyltransferase [Candidatus Omnitrophica bacterium]|nr:glycosyltransferase [Candidatus Omnitrophota bacterium]